MLHTFNVQHFGQLCCLKCVIQINLTLTFTWSLTSLFCGLAFPQFIFMTSHICLTCRSCFILLSDFNEDHHLQKKRTVVLKFDTGAINLSARVKKKKNTGKIIKWAITWFSHMPDSDFYGQSLQRWECYLCKWPILLPSHVCAFCVNSFAVVFFYTLICFIFVVVSFFTNPNIYLPFIILLLKIFYIYTSWLSVTCGVASRWSLERKQVIWNWLHFSDTEITASCYVQSVFIVKKHGGKLTYKSFFK